MLPVRHERGNRLWLPGPGEEIQREIRGGLPKDMPDGDYELLLPLPDAYASLRSRPEYAIRLATAGVWETATGMNKLGIVVPIRGSADLATYDGKEWFVPRDGRTPVEGARLKAEPAASERSAQ